MRVCDYIAKYFKKINIDKVFGFQGGAITPLIDSIALEGIKYYQACHEQAAGFMADSVSRIEGRLSVAMATNGPGVTNLITSIANAYLDNAPVLFITGQVATADIKTDNIRQNGFQEVDTVKIAQSVTKYAALVKNTNDVLYELQKAVYITKEGRCGAVLLDFPLDILMSEIDIEKQREFIPDIKIKNDFKIDETLELLKKSKRPVALIGGGVRQAGAIKEVNEFISKTSIPTVSTLMGKDTVFGNSAGFSGLYGLTGANLAIYNSDLLIVFGSRLSKRQFGKNIENYAPSAKIIQIDTDKSECNHVVKSDIFINCDIKEFLSNLNKNNLPVCPTEWIEKIKEYKEKYKNDIYVNHDNDPIKIIEKISSIALNNAIITTDVGQNQMWCAQGWKIKKGQRFLTSGGLGCMGFSLPAAIGASIVSNAQIIAFTGDGGFQMNLQELQTIKTYDLNVKIVIFNNNSLGMIQENQYKYLNSRYIGTKEGYYCPDIKKIAFAYDINYYNENKITDFLADNEASILEIKLKQEPTRLLIKYDKKNVYDEEKIF